MTQQRARRVLIVEDEFLIALYLEDMLTGMGHQVVAATGHLDKAIELARGDGIDFAVLDINLGSDKSFPVADVLRERHIPFVFATGYGTEDVANGYRNETVLRKPYAAADLEGAMAHCEP